MKKKSSTLKDIATAVICVNIATAVICVLIIILFIIGLVFDRIEYYECIDKGYPRAMCQTY